MHTEISSSIDLAPTHAESGGWNKVSEELGSRCPTKKERAAGEYPFYHLVLMHLVGVKD